MANNLTLTRGQDVVSNLAVSYDGVTLAAGSTLDVQYSYSYGFLIGPQLADAGALQNAGTVEVEDAALSVAGAIDNAGIIFINGSTAVTGAGGSSGSQLTIAGSTVELTGGGRIVMSDDDNNQIAGGTSGGVNALVNVDNAISGAGTIGTYNGTFVIALTNEARGVVDADQSAALVLQGAGANVFQLANAGLIEATGAGQLLLTDARISNAAGGVVLASGAGAVVALQTFSVIAGGTLETSGGGLIEIVGGANNSVNTLDGSESAVTITSGSTVQVNDGQYLELAGTIVNAGTIRLASTGGGAALVVNSPTATLSGGGQVVMSAGGINNIIEGVGNGLTDPNTLINVDNTISGDGAIDAGNGTFAIAVANEAAGVIDANLSSALTLYLLTMPMANAGLLEATGAGGLFVQSSQIKSSSSGTLLAAGAGDDVVLTGGATLDGGTLKTTGGGLIVIASDGNAQQTINGATIATGGTVQVGENAFLNLLGTIANSGTISIAGTNNGGQLLMNSPTVTLTGGGEIVLASDPNSNNYIGGVTADGIDTLLNIDNTIVGSGQIATGNGYNALTLDNAAAGTIESTGDLLIAATVTGAGTLKIDGGAVLELERAAAGQTADFAARTAIMRLDEPAEFAGTIENFAAGNVIVLAGVSGVSSTFDGTNLIVTNSSGTINTFHFTGAYAPGEIAAIERNGTAVIVDTVPSAAGLPSVSASFTPTEYNTLLTTLNSITPDGTTPNTVAVAAGVVPSPVAGALNVEAVTSAGAGVVATFPAGFQAAYLEVVGSALQDSVGGAALIDADGGTLLGAANDTLFGGDANDTLVAFAGAETIYGGAGDNLMELVASTPFVNSQGADTIVGSSGNGTVNATGAPLYFGEGGATLFNALGTSATLAGAGAETINAGSADMLVFGGATGGIDFFAGSGSSTVVTYAGGGTLNGGSTSTLFFGIGPASYDAGAAVDTVIGYGGGFTATGGANGTLFFTGAAGGNILSTGAGSSTIIGFGTGDLYNAMGGGADVVEAAGASSTIDGSQSAGANSFFAFASNDVVIGGSGQNAIESAFGNQTLIAGSGSTLFELLDSGAARTVVVENFVAGQDYVQLQGYGAGAGVAALQTETTTGGSEVLTLADGTTVAFQGVTGLTAASFV